MINYISTMMKHWYRGNLYRSRTASVFAKHKKRSNGKVKTNVFIQQT